MATGLFGAAANEDFMAFLGDEESLDVARQFAASHSWPAQTVMTGGLEDAVQVMGGAKVPKVVLVDIAGSQDARIDIAQLARQLGPESAIITVGTHNDVALFRQLVAAGAADYLVKPLQIESLAQAVEAARPGAKEAVKNRLTVVVGVRGGAGASTIVTNLAWIMARELKAKTALLDLDLHFGTSTLSLDLEPGSGLREILENPHRLDKLFLDSVVVQESERLSVLGTEEPIEEVIRFDADAVASLIKELRYDYDQVVIDLPRTLLPLHRSLLKSADNILLVTDQSLAGIRDINRIAQIVASLEGEAELSVVVSRVGNERKAQISKTDFERGIGRKIDFQLAEDAKTMTASANAGKAVAEVGPKSPLARNLREMAQRVSGLETPAGKKLFGLSFGNKDKGKMAGKAGKTGAVKGARA